MMQAFHWGFVGYSWMKCLNILTKLIALHRFTVTEIVLCTLYGVVFLSCILLTAWRSCTVLLIFLRENSSLSLSAFMMEDFLNLMNFFVATRILVSMNWSFSLVELSIIHWLSSSWELTFFLLSFKRYNCSTRFQHFTLCLLQFFCCRWCSDST